MQMQYSKRLHINSNPLKRLLGEVDVPLSVVFVECGFIDCDFDTQGQSGLSVLFVNCAYRECTFNDTVLDEHTPRWVLDPQWALDPPK